MIRTLVAAFVSSLVFTMVAQGGDAPGTIAYPDTPLRHARPRENFTPSTEGKKMLLYRGPSFEYMKNKTEEMEEIAFDGLILGGMTPFFNHPERPMDVDKLFGIARNMKEVPFKRYTDNFYLVYSFSGDEKAQFDWHHDLSPFIENWRLAAKVAKEGGFKGICFDSEFYGGLPLFGYKTARYNDTKSQEEYERMVRFQAAKIMRAVNSEYPDITIIFLFGFSAGHYAVPQHPYGSKAKYTLLPAFVDGMVSAADEGTTIHDQHEPSFSFREPGSYARARAIMTELMPLESHYPEDYRDHYRAGFSFWADCWGDNSKGRPFHVDDFEKNYYTPEEFASSIHHGLAYSDKYMWMWPGAINWFKREVKTIDDKGEEVVRPLPKEYIQALLDAHKPSLPVPSRDRKPNTYRNLSASTQAGYKDEITFGDLWEEYTFIENVPLVWRFHLDPDEVGEASSWHKSEFDDTDWSTIQIREFWEMQGYSPYDGQAWYRLWYDAAVKAEEGTQYYLAFGAVAEEAEVFINGESKFKSVYGDNIRHARFLVDVTEQVKTGRPFSLAVRVWNTGWCGGIWKNIKLVSKTK